MPRNILIAINACPASDNAFKWAMENVYRKNDTIFLAHVPEPISLPSFTFKEGLNLPAQNWAKNFNDQAQSIKSMMDKFQTNLNNDKVKHRIIIAEQNSCIGDGIIDISETENIDMIVIGSRLLGSLERYWTGSVSDHVLQKSRKPVFICPHKRS